jgi:hypothetical protein
MTRWFCVISVRIDSVLRKCPPTHVVIVVSKVDKDESKEESDLVGLACKLDVDFSDTHVVVAGRLAEQ